MQNPYRLNNARMARSERLLTVAISAFFLIAATTSSAQPSSPAVPEHDAQENSDQRHVTHSHEPLTIDASLSLTELLETTFMRYPRQIELEAHLAEADALVDAASRWLSAAPTLYFSYLSDAPLDALDQREYDAGVSLPLWRAGQRRAARGLGQSASMEASAAELALRWEIAGLLRNSLWDIAGAANAVELSQGSVEIAAELVQSVERRREVGDLPLGDELLARTALLEKQVALIDAEARLLDAERAYRSLTGRDARPLEFSETQTALEDFSDDHPMLALANAEIARANAQLALVEKTVKGSPSLSIGPHRQRDPLASFFSNSLTVGVSVPVGGASHRRAESAQAARRLAEAQARRGTLLRELDRSLHEAEHEIFVVEESMEIASERATLAERQRLMGETAFTEGEIELRDYLRIQESALTAQRELAGLEIQRQRMIAMQNQALGELP